MKALRFHAHGGTDVLTYEDVADPAPAPGEAIVAVRACAVNGLDIFARRGETETDIELPMTTGADISGEIVALGSGADIPVGSRVVINPRLYCGKCWWCLRGEQSACEQYRVIGWHRPGGFADLVAVPVAACTVMSDSISFRSAAAFPITFTTAWRMLISRARVRPGETVLILGASGGVGSAAVQVANLIGARVAATTRGQRKAQAVAELGAELVIDYEATDATDQIAEWTNGRGVDVVVQTQGGATWAASLEQVKRTGRIVVCAALQGGTPTEDLGTVIWKQIEIIGSTGATPLDFAAVLSRVESGSLVPLVDAVYPLSDGAAAQAAFERHDHVGKIILEPSGAGAGAK